MNKLRIVAAGLGLTTLASVGLASTYKINKLAREHATPGCTSEHGTANIQSDWHFAGITTFQEANQITEIYTDRATAAALQNRAKNFCETGEITELADDFLPTIKLIEDGESPTL